MYFLSLFPKLIVPILLLATLKSPWQAPSVSTVQTRSIQKYQGKWYAGQNKLDITIDYDDRFVMEFKGQGRSWSAICYLEKVMECSGFGNDQSRGEFNIKLRARARRRRLKMGYALGGENLKERKRITFRRTAVENNTSAAKPPFKGCARGSEKVKPFNLAFEKQVLTIVNKERSRRGLSALKWDNKLALAARYHAADMAVENYFEHDSFDRNGSSLQKACRTFTRIGAFDKRPSAENIAAGSRTPEGVMKQWMNSPGHKRNILSAGSRRLGIGLYQHSNGKYGYYWVQNFGR